MAATDPEYFFPPNWEYFPGGPIRIGNVITSRKKPHDPLVSVKPEGGTVVTVSKTSTQLESDKKSSRGASVEAMPFSGLVGIGMSVSLNIQKKSVCPLRYAC